MLGTNDHYTARFEIFLQSHEACHVLRGPFSIRKWMRFAAIPINEPRVALMQEVINDQVSSGRMLKGLAGLGLGFARGTLVYEIVPPSQRVPLLAGMPPHFAGYDRVSVGEAYHEVA
jgi:hypothetical protein